MYCIDFKDLCKWKLPILPVIITYNPNRISLLIHIVFFSYTLGGIYNLR